MAQPKEPNCQHDMYKGCSGCEAKKAESPNVKLSLTEDLFNEAVAEVETEQIEQYKRDIKAKLREKAAAERVLANINREIDDLLFRIRQEVG